MLISNAPRVALLIAHHAGRLDDAPKCRYPHVLATDGCERTAQRDAHPATWRQVTLSLEWARLEGHCAAADGHQVHNVRTFEREALIRADLRICRGGPSG